MARTRADPTAGAEGAVGGRLLAPADAQGRRAVPPDQDGEGSPVVDADEVVQQPARSTRRPGRPDSLTTTSKKR
jgi:hypothetical protein